MSRMLLWPLVSLVRVVSNDRAGGRKFFEQMVRWVRQPLEIVIVNGVSWEGTRGFLREALSMRVRRRMEITSFARFAVHARSASA